jgi:hypothetical protein
MVWLARSHLDEGGVVEAFVSGTRAGAVVPVELLAEFGIRVDGGKGTTEVGVHV